MDWKQTLVTLLTVLLGSGLIQFFFTRKDKLKEDEKKDSADSIKKELKDHLADTNAQWKIDYCDKNAKLIEELAIEAKQGLKDREETGLQRYKEHQESIQELKKAILALTEDVEERKVLEKYIGNSLMALTHDKLVYLGKCYQKRGSITLSEKNNLRLLFEPYHNGLGGNSDGEGYYNYCMGLPVVTDEEALKMDSENKQEIVRQLANQV